MAATEAPQPRRNSSISLIWRSAPRGRFTWLITTAAFHKVDPNGSTITAVVGNGRYWGYPIPDGTPALRTGIRQLHGLAFDFYNQLHFVGGDGLIYRLERNGTLTLFSNGLDLEPGRMIFNPDGNLIIADRRFISRFIEVSADGRRVRTIVDLESDGVSALRSAGPAKSELSEYQREHHRR